MPQYLSAEDEFLRSLLAFNQIQCTFRIQEVTDQNNSYKYQFYNPQTKKKISVSFQTHISNTSIYHPSHVFSCILKDSQIPNSSFEDFINEYGYENNSEAKRVYKACEKSKLKLQKLMPDYADYNWHEFEFLNTTAQQQFLTKKIDHFFLDPSLQKAKQPLYLPESTIKMNSEGLYTDRPAIGPILFLLNTAAAATLNDLDLTQVITPILSTLLYDKQWTPEKEQIIFDYPESLLDFHQSYIKQSHDPIDTSNLTFIIESFNDYQKLVNQTKTTPLNNENNHVKAQNFKL